MEEANRLEVFWLGLKTFSTRPFACLPCLQRSHSMPQQALEMTPSSPLGWSHCCRLAGEHQEDLLSLLPLQTTLQKVELVMAEE